MKFSFDSVFLIIIGLTGVISALLNKNIFYWGDVFIYKGSKKYNKIINIITGSDIGK